MEVVTGPWEDAALTHSSLSQPSFLIPHAQHISILCDINT